VPQTDYPGKKESTKGYGEKPFELLSLLQNSAAGRLPGMATKGTKTQLVTFVLFVVRQHF